MIDTLVNLVDLPDERQQIRQHFLVIRDQICQEKQRAGSDRIVESVLSLPIFQDKHIFCIYSHYRSEVKTTSLLQCCLARGKTVAVPLCLPEQGQMVAVGISDVLHDLAPGFKGIPEPLAPVRADQILAPASIEVVVVPGLVFDNCGHRLGYGKGFYDRFLAQSAPQAVRIGLAFCSQMVERLPVLSHDVPMDMVVTDQGLLVCPERRDG